MSKFAPMYSLRWIIIIAACVLCSSVSALTVYTECSKNVVEQYGEVIITYTIDNDDVDDVEFPKVNNIRLSGTSNSSYTVFENGKFKSLKKYQFFLTPMEVGTYTIPPATVYYKNKKLSTKPIIIKVIDVQGNASNTPPPPSQKNNNKGHFDLSENLFIRVAADKPQAYVGEQVVLTYKVYSTIKYENMQMVKAPNYNKCITEEFNIDINAEPQIETYNGRRYYANIFKKIALFPTESGEIVIPPILMEGTALIPQDVNVISGMNIQMESPKDVKLYTNQLKLTVQNLPTPSPKSFSGGVGKFSLQTSIDNAHIGTGEPITLNMKVTGAGNLKILQAPQLALPKHLQSYPPNVTENIDNNGNTLQGDKNFEYLIVPDATGTYILPPVEFSYFDIEKNDYVTYKIPLQDINVDNTISSKKNKNSKFNQSQNYVLKDIKKEMMGSSWSPYIYFGIYALGLLLASTTFFVHNKSKRNLSLPSSGNPSSTKQGLEAQDLYTFDDKILYADDFTFLSAIRKKFITALEYKISSQCPKENFSESRGVKEEFLVQQYYEIPKFENIYEKLSWIGDQSLDKERWEKYKQFLHQLDSIIYANDTNDIDKNKIYSEGLQLLEALRLSPK